jgi:uncharacterized protein YuzE
MPRAEYNEIQPGETAWMVEVRSDLHVDLDADGRVLGVERVGDDVRFRDLEDVIRVLVFPDDEESN